MTHTHQEFSLETVDQTIALAHALADRLIPGLPLLLSGPVGAGKSLIARTIIQHRLALENKFEDVPSPTFTLVQVYDLADTEIWHCDLYRLGDPNEVFELGLDEAMENAICLIEWPDRLGDLEPENTLKLTLRYDGEGRAATLEAPIDWGTLEL
ncbi:MAG: tRNA (adenosine(37)-N6)-threonylcarbamoyltransferase complex ATPase subunit type 1 TsaE [Paracoccaceae bacterium]|nr:tRNA (adenosine(37)-N6)-threonylcarbamoyltransferase complex ATPase subunit type 1 TsaE [Paracoccaceae bacterium]